MRRAIILGGLCLAIIGALVDAPGSDAEAVAFSDSTFNDADWTAFELAATPATTFTLVATQLGAGGNPGAYRSVVVTSFSPVGDVGLSTGHLFAGGIFDPGEDGHFVSLDFKIDGISIGSTGALGYGLLLVQGGKRFVATSVMALNGEGWKSVNQPGFTGTEFFQSFPDGTGSSFDPDFSDAGGPIQLGFYNVSLAGPAGVAVNTGGVDNWSVTIHTRELTPVPAAAALALLAAGLGLVVSRIRTLHPSL